MKFWTPAELRAFLVCIESSDHYPLLRVASMTGLRRGELCGLRWVDVDLEAGTISVVKSVTCVRGAMLTGDVKTKRSHRVIDLDTTTLAVVKAWRKQQTEHRLLMGPGWIDSGLVFTMATRGRLEPADSVTGV